MLAFRSADSRVLLALGASTRDDLNKRLEGAIAAVRHHFRLPVAIIETMRHS
jgi:hypothetical protein